MANYVHHMIHTGSDRPDQLKLIVDTKSHSMLFMSRKVSKSQVRVAEDGEGRMTVNGPSGGVEKGQGYIPPKPSQSREHQISSINNAVNHSSFCQEPHKANFSPQGI